MREKMFVTILILCSAIPTLIGGGLSKDAPTVVNLMMDADINPSPTMDDVNVYYRHLINISDVIEGKHLNATIFTTSEMATADRIGITRMQSLDNYEIAMHGNATGENLSAMPRAEQESLLKKEIGFVNNCFICGGKEPDVKGFRP